MASRARTMYRFAVALLHRDVVRNLPHPQNADRQERQTIKKGKTSWSIEGNFFFYPNPTENAFTIFSKNA